SRKISRKRPASHQSLSCGIHCYPGTTVISAAAKIGRVQRSGTCRVQFCNECVSSTKQKTSPTEVWLVSAVRGGKIIGCRGTCNVSVVKGVHSDAESSIVTAATEVRRID